MSTLDQPAVVRCIEMEATALAAGEVIEVAHYDFNPATGAITGGWSELCRTTANPAETRAIHHIRTSELVDCPRYDRHVIHEAAVRDGVVAWAAHNTGLEEQFLPNGLPIVCTYKAGLRAWPDAPGNHGLFALLYHLEDEGVATYDQALAWPAHRALPDAYACAVGSRPSTPPASPARTWCDGPANRACCRAALSAPGEASGGRRSSGPCWTGL